MADTLTCDVVYDTRGRPLTDPCAAPKCFVWDAHAWVQAARIEFAAVSFLRSKMTAEELLDLSKVRDLVESLSITNHMTSANQSEKNVMQAVRATQASRCLRATVKSRLAKKNKPPSESGPGSVIPSGTSETGIPVAPDTWQLPGLPGINLPSLPSLSSLLKSLLPWLLVALGVYAVVQIAPAAKAVKTARSTRKRRKRRSR